MRMNITWVLLMMLAFWLWCSLSISGTPKPKTSKWKKKKNHWRIRSGGNAALSRIISYLKSFINKFSSFSASDLHLNRGALIHFYIRFLRLLQCSYLGLYRLYQMLQLIRHWSTGRSNWLNHSRSAAIQ